MNLFAPTILPIKVPTVKEQPAFIDPFLTLHAETLDAAGDNKLTYDAVPWSGQPTALDVECYRNVFLVCLKNLITGAPLAFEESDRSTIDQPTLKRMLLNNTIVTFNGENYDLVLVTLLLRGATLHMLKDASDRIILKGVRPWQLGVRVPQLDHIDLLEPNPSIRASLKVLHGRLHGQFMVDLPYEPDALLTPRQINVLTLYCHNDLDATESVWRAMQEPLALREVMGKEYGVNLLSKSDAQLSETIATKRVEQVLRRKLQKPEHSPKTFNYQVPSFIKFIDPQFNDLIIELEKHQFYANTNGDITVPEFLKQAVIKIASSEYRIGIGGLHSVQSNCSFRFNEDEILIDVDVASEYPTIILNLGLYPETVGEVFLEIYRNMINERLLAKQKVSELNKQIEGK